MRKYLISLMLAAGAVAGCSASGFAAEEASLFPPDMLEQYVAPGGLTASVVPAAPTVEEQPTASFRPAVVVAAPHSTLRIRPVHHVRNVHRVHAPVQVARHIPLPVARIRVADTTSCPGFCGKYVFVGVGF